MDHRPAEETHDSPSASASRTPSQPNRISLHHRGVQFALELERHVPGVVLLHRDLPPGAAYLEAVRVERAGHQRVRYGLRSDEIDRDALLAGVEAERLRDGVRQAERL